MRTLSAELTTAQQDDTRTPYVQVTFTKFDRTVVRTYTTNDSPNRVLLVKQAEGRFDEDNRELLGINDTDLPISAVIQLRDSDQAINILDHKGYIVRIGWGFNTTAGFEISNSPALIVIEQRSVSFEGQLAVELYCMSIFDLARFGWAKQTTLVNIRYNGDVSVRHLMMDLLGGVPAEAVLVLDNNLSTYEDMTAQAKDPTDGSDLGVDDVFILPSLSGGTAEAVNDAFIIGHTDLFDIISIDLTVLGVKGAGAASLAFEYVTAVDGALAPTTWSTLSTVVDNTSEFTVGELKTIRFNLPTNWVRAIIDGKPVATGYYYMRIRLASGTYATTNPKATKIILNRRHAGISLDTSTAGQGDDRTPDVSFNLREDLIEIVKALLGETLLALTIEDDGFHLKFKDDSVGSIDYTYKVPETTPASDHAFFVGMLREHPIVPNSIQYLNYRPAELADVTGAVAVDSDSVTALGTIKDIRYSPDLATTQQKADDLATDAIKRLLRDAVQASMEVPMNVGQEVWDVIQVIDTRSGQTHTTIISQLLRTYEPGFYRLQMFSGGAVSGTGNLIAPPKGPAIPEPVPVDPPPPELPPVVTPPAPPPAVPPPPIPDHVPPSPSPAPKRDRPIIPNPHSPTREITRSGVGGGVRREEFQPTDDPVARPFRGQPLGGEEFERQGGGQGGRVNIPENILAEQDRVRRLIQRQQRIIAEATPFLNPQDIGAEEVGSRDPAGIRGGRSIQQRRELEQAFRTGQLIDESQEGGPGGAGPAFAAPSTGTTITITGPGGESRQIITPSRRPIPADIPRKPRRDRPKVDRGDIGKATARQRRQSKRSRRKEQDRADRRSRRAARRSARA